MFHIRPFEPADLAVIKLQPAQMYLSEWVTRDQANSLAEYPSYTAFEGASAVAAAGIVPMWQGRAMAWAFISAVGPHKFLRVHRAVKHFLDGCFIQRIEMTVDSDFTQGHRWARMLGFNLEAERMQAYAPDGHDCALYARVL